MNNPLAPQLIIPPTTWAGWFDDLRQRAVLAGVPADEVTAVLCYWARGDRLTPRDYAALTSAMLDLPPSPIRVPPVRRQEAIA